MKKSLKVGLAMADDLCIMTDVSTTPDHKEVTMLKLNCPIHKGECGEIVEADLGTFSDTTATVQACSKAKEISPALVSYTVRKSLALEAAVPVQHGPVRHADGLVWMSGVRA